MAPSPQAPRYAQPWLAGNGRPFERPGTRPRFDHVGRRLIPWRTAAGRMRWLPAFLSDDDLERRLERPLTRFELGRAHVWRTGHAAASRWKTREAYDATFRGGGDEAFRVIRAMSRSTLKEIRPGLRINRPPANPFDRLAEICSALTTRG